MCVALVASLTEEMAARSIAYHAHGTADGGKSCCYPWLVCHDIKSAVQCSLRLAPTMINHLTSIYIHVLTHVCKYNAHPYMYLHMYGYTCVLRLKSVPLRNLAHRQIPFIPQTSLHLVFHFHTSSLISLMNGLSDRYTLTDRLVAVIVPD